MMIPYFERFSDGPHCGERYEKWCAAVPENHPPKTEAPNTDIDTIAQE
jgi:hypothetical protein